MSLPTTWTSAGQNVSKRGACSSGKPTRSDVVGQRIGPHVHDMCRIAGHRDAPVERRARDRQVLEAAFDEAHDLVAPLERQDELRVRVVVREQLLAVARQAETVRLLLGPLDRRAERLAAHAIGADGRLVLLEIRLLAHRVPARVGVEVDVAGIGHPAPQRLARGVVARLGRADEIVVRDGERREQLAEARRVAVGQFLRRNAGLQRGLLHLEAVLVGAGQEVHLMVVETRKPGHHVARDRRIGVPEMGLAVGIVDRRRDVEGLASAHGIGAPWGPSRTRDAARRA